MNDELLKQILDELKKLNRSVAEVLCAQKIQAARWKAKQDEMA
jgi:K+-sensing histidine kinase KdpD